MEEIEDFWWNGVHARHGHVQIILMMMSGCEKQFEAVDVKDIMMMGRLENVCSVIVPRGLSNRACVYMMNIKENECYIKTPV